MARILTCLALTISWLLISVEGQYEQSTFIANGAALYTSVPVGAVTETILSSPAKPTMGYNCAWMPAICNNIFAVEGPAFFNRTLVFDSNRARNEQRGRSVCPDSKAGAREWKRNHVCPENNQPLVIDRIGGPTKPNPIALRDPTRLRTDPNAYEISFPPGRPAPPGNNYLRYSCDEYPPKTFIQGGSGVPGGTPGSFSTYCAPISLCNTQGIRGTSGEQNWQGTIHSRLSDRIGSAGLYPILFQITRSASVDWAAWVIWTSPQYQRGDFVIPRDLGVVDGNNATAKDSSTRFIMAVHAPSSKVLHYTDHESNGTLQQISKKRFEKMTTKVTSTKLHHQLLRRQSGASSSSANSSIQTTGSAQSPVQQNFGNGSAPVDIQQLSPVYIQGQGHVNSSFDVNATAWSNATLLGSILAGTTGQSQGNKRDLSRIDEVANPMLTNDTTQNERLSARGFTIFDKRAADAIQCGVGQECADGSCCAGVKCGYGPDHCGSNCTSNCHATAMCGKDSAGGSKRCGLNLCCSYYGWCGTEAIHCVDSDTEHQTAPCQQGFGGCQQVSAPKCGTGSGSASKGRKVGYYQASNVRTRACNRISPAQIKTDGFSHLFFAFAGIDPVSFQVTPLDESDPSLYRAFTALKTTTLQAWIAIGGFDFSDPGPTRTTWSDMVSSSANRAAFISSLVKFTDDYGFDGVDLDWEYPAADTRGGQDADTQNLVSLVKELRTAFGTKKGISMTLAPDYWYLRGFDPKAMQDSVDFFGFMAYDLHGSWDADTKTLGSIIRPQTDIRDIDLDLLPLWFAGVDPKKVNFGLAYYGRGYTVKGGGGASIGDGFSGPSKPGPCTNFPGVLSLREIESIINSTGAQPELVPNAMVKQLRFNNDQWVGYDDEQTFALKMQYADNACLGGTMIWSVDFASGQGSGDVPDGGGSNSSNINGDGGIGNHVGPVTYSTSGACGPANNGTFCAANSGSYNGTCCSSSGYCGSTTAYCGTGCISGCDGKEVIQYGSLASSIGSDVLIDPSLWKEGDPAALSCNPPCRLILPPFPLSSASNINIDPITASWTITQTLTSAKGSTTAVSVTKYITTSIFSPSPIMSASSVNISAITIPTGLSGSSSLTAKASITPPPIVVTYSVPPIDPSSTTSSSSGIAAAGIVFGGSAPGGQRTRTIFPPPGIDFPKPPRLPGLSWHPGPPNPLCLINCPAPPPDSSSSEIDGGRAKCSGDDCGPGENINDSGCVGSNCPSPPPGPPPGDGSDNSGGSKNPDEEDDEDDEEDDDQTCTWEPTDDSAPASPNLSGFGPPNADGLSQESAGSSPPSSASPPTTTVAAAPSSDNQSPPPPPSSSASPHFPLALARSLITCNPYLPAYHACFFDIHANLVEDCAAAMYGQLPSNAPLMTAKSPNITQVYRDHNTFTEKEQGVTYMMNIGWIPGCDLGGKGIGKGGESQAADNPLGKSGDGSISYTELIRETYYDCHSNQGLGGYQDVGCLRYGFYPNDVRGVFDSPPHPEKFWQAGMNICG